MLNGAIYKSGKGGKIFVIRIKPKNDLFLKIRELVEKEGIKAGVILSGVGLLEKASIRNCKILPKEYPITDTNRSYVKLNGPLEILSISGNISEVKGKPLVHAHITLSGVKGNDEIYVVGGHLLEGCIIFGFAEVIIMELNDIEMKKSMDYETRTYQLFA